MKTVYLFNPQNGEYSGSTVIHPPQIKGGEITITHSTEVAPTHGADQTSFWNGESWDIVADHRGKTIYNRVNEELKVETVGELLEDYSFTPFPPTPEQIEIKRIEELRATCEIDKQKPVEFEEHIYAADNDSAIELNATIGSYAHIPLPEDYFLITADGIEIQFDYAKLKELYSAIQARNWALTKQLQVDIANK